MNSGEPRAIIDNFDLIASTMEDLTDTDYAYFIVIIKRKKDNPLEVASYCEYPGQYLVKNKEELLKIKDEIIQKSYNCRVYYKPNKRHVPTILKMAKDLMSGVEMKMTINRPIIVTNIMEALREAGRHARNKPEDEKDFPATLIDIDDTDVNIYNGVKNMLNSNNIPIWFEYQSPSGGFHIITKDRRPVRLDFSAFNGYVKNKLLAKVDAIADGGALLYCNIVKRGY